MQIDGELAEAHERDAKTASALTEALSGLAGAMGKVHMATSQACAAGKRRVAAAEALGAVVTRLGTVDAKALTARAGVAALRETSAPIVALIIFAERTRALGLDLLLHAVHDQRASALLAAQLGLDSDAPACATFSEELLAAARGKTG
jgi:hypothetical protein